VYHISVVDRINSLKHQNEQFQKELDALKTNNEELGSREEQYREAVKKLHDKNQELEDDMSNKSHHSKIQLEEVKKQNRKYEEKIKDLTQVNNNEKIKRAEEVKKLRSQIKNLTEEMNNNNAKNGYSEEELKIKAEEIARSTINEINVKIAMEKDYLFNEIDKLKQELENARSQMDDQSAEFEREKVDISNRMLADSNTDQMIKDSQSHLIKLRTEIDALKHNLKIAEAAIGEKNTSIKKKDTEIKILEEEMEDKTKQLEKYKSGASEEMKDLQERVTEMEKEKRKLLLKIGDLERARDETEGMYDKHRASQMDVENKLREKIKDIEAEGKAIKRGFEEGMNDERQRHDHLRQQISEIAGEKDKVVRVNTKLEDEMMRLKKTHNDFHTFKDTIVLTAKKILKSYELIDSNLSCLSCLEFLEDPLMLICGHSICLKCFKTHSDPNSKDSIVF
jgi:chromosome segregation ATPase